MSTEYFSSIAGSTNAASSTVNSNNNNNACTSTRWLTEEVFGLIDLVQRNEAIYNPRHKYYFCRPYVENFWREVDLKLEKNPGASLAKWTNLRISFRREYTNYLEEKVPPCWTYFDRMFFLHPYLRKHQQSKSLDSQVQDALVQISSLSNRLQRERAVAAAASAAASSLHNPSNTASPSQPPLDNYLEYFDDPEPNSSELDDLIDDDPRNPQDFAHSTLANDIKSECEDNTDEYDHVERNHALDEDETEVDDAEMRNFVLNSLEKRQQQQQQQQQQQLRLQHLQRLQTRGFYEDFRHKRARSHDNIISSQTTSSSLMASSSTSNHTTNVSFVRPTFAKPLEVVSTTTQSLNNSNSSSISNNSNNSNGSASTSTALSNDNEPVINSSTRLNSSTSHYASTLSHAHGHHQHQRFEISALNSVASNTTTLNPLATPTTASTNSTTLVAAPAPATPELCDCKTDPDAMFLMSLLPDIQKLNGRDRGKIKIAFQNILQDYLYPD